MKKNLIKIKFGTTCLLAGVLLISCAGRKIGDPIPKGNIAIPTTRSIHFNNQSKLQKEHKTGSENI